MPRLLIAAVPSNENAPVRNATLAVVLAVGILWLRPGRARAGGFEYGSQGAEAVGRAGAFVARGDNPSNLYWNVGTMGRMEDGTHVLIDSNFCVRTLEFRRAGEMDFDATNRYRADGLPYPGVSDATPVNVGPMIGVVTDFGLDSDFVFGIGAMGPAAIGQADFPTQVYVVNNVGEKTLVPGPQRYDLLYQNIVFVWPTLAVGYRISDDLAVGAGFQPGFVHIVYQMMAAASGGEGEDDVDQDIRSNIDDWDPFVAAGVFGAWWRPFKYLEVAFSTRMSDGIDAGGPLETISNPYGVAGQNPISSADWTDYDTEYGEKPPYAHLSFDWPFLVARFGFRFVWPRDSGEIVGDELDPGIASRLARLAPHEREWFDIELDVTYEMNSSVTSFRTKVDGVVPVGYGLPNIAVRPSSDPDVAGVLEVPHMWQDTVALRLGGDVNLLEGMLSLHWGAMFETASVPEEYTRLDYANWMTFGVAGGVTVRLPWYGIDLTASYQRQFMPDRNVEGGQARMLLALPPNDETTIPTINDGAYESAYDIFSIGAAARF
jgi:hypothetical protein